MSTITNLMMLHLHIVRTHLFIVLFWYAKCHILRLPCGTRYADFTIYYKDARLNGPVMQSINGVDDIQCMVHCVEHPICRSYAINKYSKICYLYNRRFGDDESTAMVSEIGWIYKTTDFMATLIGPNCLDLNPCPIGATCKDSCDPPYFQCVQCNDDHFGLDCERRKDFNECADVTCKNNGSCSDGVGNYTCICKPGFTGMHCETDIDECYSLPCLNGALCIDLADGYECSCKEHTWGDLCEQGFESCNDILSNRTEMGIPTPNGVYTLKDGPHHCKMESLSGCNGLGWTLAIKVNGTKGTFAYKSSYWTNDDVYRVEDGIVSFLEGEAKFPAFNRLNFISICIGMKKSNAVIWHQLSVSSSSLQELFAAETYLATRVGRNGWKEMVQGASLQRYCDQEGVNIATTRGIKFARIGIISNNENECESPDSYIGFGLNPKQGCASSLPSIVCGNYATCGSDNGDGKAIATMGYILVK